ncbi:hypothetical protein C1S70_31020 (plasmid) [Azospirillum argentinense]|uniref:Patatin-like phospholipase n=1 Tax=Azospirillum argentinense TaxID=2970906 RepID=A0A2K1FRG4_9PROT|nr:hypothetical protein [Azospirillum argentinense]PNQ95039.1 hypothetical protein C1S70_31020 [Azospirillum argentinense]
MLLLKYCGSALKCIGFVWEVAKTVGILLWPARFTVLVLFVMWTVLQVGPAQDVLYAVFVEPQSGHARMLFLIGLWIWALQSWYWTRFLFYLPRRPQPQLLYAAAVLGNPYWQVFFDTQLPRFLGVAAFFVVAEAILKCGRFAETWPWAFLLLAHGIVFYTFTAARRYLLNRQTHPTGGERAWRTANRVARAGRGALADTPEAALLQRNAAVGPTRGIDVVGAAYAAWLSAVLLVASTAYWSPPDFGWLKMTVVVLLAGGSLAGAVRLLAQLDLPVGTRRAVIGLLVLTLASFLASIVSPVTAGVLFGPGGALMLAAAAWVGTTSFFLAYPGERLRLPVTLLLVLIAAFGALTGEYLGYDHHGVRLLPVPENWRPDTRPKLRDAFEAWYAQAPCLSGADGACWEKVMVLVAAEGGASRSAYWTATVLGDLEDSHPGFHRSIFALSGVSGGALGLTIYRELLAVGNGVPPACADTKGGMVGGFARCGQAVLDADFLGPIFFRLFHTDLMQWLLPGNLLPDRAAALENTWEWAWGRRMTGSPHRLSAAFERSQGTEWQPLLLLNGASTKTGRRIVTSDVLLTRCPDPADPVAQVANPEDLPDTVDFFCLVRHPVRVSTAAHNSARFPYVSPAGTLWTHEGKADRIVDGGYFESLGATTLFDLLPPIRTIAGDRAVRVVVIAIQNDPTGGDDMLGPFVKAIGKEAAPMDAALRLSPELLSPVLGFAASRSGRGSYAGASLERAVRNDTAPGFIRFNLRDKENAHRAADPAMSWFLSQRSLKAMWSDWCDMESKEQDAAEESDSAHSVRRKGNADSLRDLGLALGDPKPWKVNRSEGINVCAP